MNEKKYVNREREIRPQTLTEYDEQAARERRARRIQEMKRQKARRLLIQKCVMIAVPILAIVLVGTVLLTTAGKASAKHDKGTVQGENTEAGGNLGVDTVGNKAENTGAGTAAGGNSAGGTGGGESAGEGNFQAGNENGNALPQDGMQDTEDTLGADSGNEDENEKKIYSAQATDDTRWIGDEIISTNAIFIDLETGNILGQKDPYKVLSPASMTKILTVLVAAEHIEKEQLDDTFTMTLEITDYSYVNDCSSVGFLDGEVITVRDLFYGTILPSGGDAAVGLATYVAGSHEAFVEMMNEKLEELGLSDTAHVTNCVGLYDKEHYCTVYDMAMIIEAAIDNEICREVMNARKYTTSATEQHLEGITISNWFLRRIEDKDTGGEVLCAKTGYVAQSGNCSASYGKDHAGKEYVCVTANATSSWKCIYDHVALYKKFATESS